MVVNTLELLVASMIIKKAHNQNENISPKELMQNCQLLVFV